METSVKSGNLLNQIKVSLSSLFKKIKFFEVMNEKGVSLLFDSNTIKIGDAVHIKENDTVSIAPDGEYVITLSQGAIAITVSSGKITAIVNKETGEQLNEYTFETQPSESQAQQSVQQRKVKQNENQKTESKFIKYLKDVYLSSAEINQEEYPWEDCIADMEAQGVDCPECMCAAIKNGAVQHHINQGVASVEEAVQKVTNDVKGNSSFQYILKTLVNQGLVNQGKQKVEKKDESININELLAEVNQKITSHESMIKQLADIIALQVNVKQSVNRKPVVEDEVELFRKKYFNIK